MRTKTAPSWARLDPYMPTPCAICGECINDDEDYEAVKRRGAKVPNYYRTARIKKERAKA